MILILVMGFGMFGTQSTGNENSFDAKISVTAMETEKAGYYPFAITLDNPTAEAEDTAEVTE